jgi:hypothetical protein
VVGEALAEPFLVAAPEPGACRFCNYRRVCGPYEAQRTERKQYPEERLDGLRRLREAL